MLIEEERDFEESGYAKGKVRMNGKKKFLDKHAKSSAALISLGIHAVLLVVAISFVAVTVITKDDLSFEAKKVNRPRLKLKKLQVPVKYEKKKSQTPKFRQRIVVKKEVKAQEITMPEITGVRGATGYLNGGGGLGSLGFGLEIDIFGGNKGFGNELEGTFFDLKQKPDGSPAKMDENYFNEVVKDFASSWKVSRLEKDYFQAPNKKFATMFQLPAMSAEEAPQAYSVGDVVQPKQWVAYYTGKIAAPETGRYRFWGIGDDVLMVRVKRRLVLDANWYKGQITDWESDDENNRKFKSAPRENTMAIGDWFSLTKGEAKGRGLSNCAGWTPNPAHL
jgi:hypothetical protein